MKLGMMFFRVMQRVGFGLLVFLAAVHSKADNRPEVVLAGFAYSGAASTIPERFPYSLRFEAAQEAAGAPVYKQLLAGLSESPPKNFRITSQIDSLKGRDQAIAAALVISNETVTVEQFGALYKLSAIIRGQVMLFDFKSMNVVRAYPVSFAYIDLLNRPPTQEDMDVRVAMVYNGANGKPGLLARFSQSLSEATIPTSVSRYLQITSVEVKPEAHDGLPAFAKGRDEIAQTWAADLVGEAISTRVGVPIIPYAKGYAIGNVMSLRVSDGTVWELKLPKPDYEISVVISGFRKIKFSQVIGGATTYVYGAYADLHIQEPISGRVYFNTSLKNGETRVIPASQSYVDDALHFYDALNGLFVKTAQAFAGGGDARWLPSAASARDISSQLAQVKELMTLCKQ